MQVAQHPKTSRSQNHICPFCCAEIKTKLYYKDSLYFFWQLKKNTKQKQKRGQSVIHKFYLNNHGTLDLLISFVFQLILHWNTGKQCLFNQRMLSLISPLCSLQKLPLFRFSQVTFSQFFFITARIFQNINKTTTQAEKNKCNL